MNTKTQNVVAQVPQRSSIKAFLASKKAILAQALDGTALAPERLLGVAMTEFRKNPLLAECTQASLFGSLVQAAQLGLEPGSALGHCWLIPYMNKKKGVRECQFQIGYRGMLDLARRSGQLKSISCHAVYERDQFDIELGVEDYLKHKPALAERGAPVGYYAVVRFKDGGYQFEFMSVSEIEANRERSKAKDDGPWSTDYEAMAKKTVIRRMFKYLPISIEMQRAVGLDEQADRREQSAGLDLGLDDGTVFDAETGEVLPDKSGVKSASDLNSAL